jgi:hypothetical protein
MVYLEQLERTLLNKSSDRELSLYRFLEDKKHTFIAKQNDLEDALCSKALNGECATNELSELKKIKPFKGFHYSNNLITLVAASLVSKETESVYISEFLNSHSYRDMYIIGKALDRTFELNPIPNNAIDDLAKKILSNEIVNQDDLAKCIAQVTDLLDLFVVKQAISLSFLQYEKTVNMPLYKQLRIINQKITKRLNLFFAVTGSLVFCWFLTLITPYIVNYATTNWDQLEPLAYLLDKLLLAIGFFGAFKFINSEKAKKGVTKYFFSICYLLLGIKYSELTNIEQVLKK